MGIFLGVGVDFHARFRRSRSRVQRAKGAIEYKLPGVNRSLMPRGSEGWRPRSPCAELNVSHVTFADRRAMSAFASEDTAPIYPTYSHLRAGLVRLGAFPVALNRAPRAQRDGRWWASPLRVHALSQPMGP